MPLITLTMNEHQALREGWQAALDMLQDVHNYHAALQADDAWLVSHRLETTLGNLRAGLALVEILRANDIACGTDWLEFAAVPYGKRYDFVETLTLRSGSRWLVFGTGTPYWPPGNWNDERFIKASGKRFHGYIRDNLRDWLRASATAGLRGELSNVVVMKRPRRRVRLIS